MATDCIVSELEACIDLYSQHSDDGCALIIVNGKVLAQGSQFSLNDVEVITACKSTFSEECFAFDTVSRVQDVCLITPGAYGSTRCMNASK